MKITLKDKKVLVLGLGDTGLSALHWLESQGAILSAADSRVNPPSVEDVTKRMPQVIIHTGPFDSAVFKQADLIVISPGVALSESAVQAAIAHGVPVIGDVELFAQYRPKDAKVIAITGSNGKTTVTTLVGEICKEAGLKTIVAGNIGLPVLEALMMQTPDVYVLELSSFQLETTHHLSCDSATVLNVSEDHMDRYADIDAYIAAKARILAHAKTAVLNRDDAVSLGLQAKEQNTNTVTFGLNAAPTYEDFGLVTCDGEQCLTSGQRKLMPTNQLKISGLHNVANALAAAALCNAIDIEKAAIASALRNFKGLPHRVEWVATVNEVDFYDDSKGTNVGATCAAIAGMVKQGEPQKVVLIAGGDGKGQDFAPLLPAVKANARAVVLIGRDAALIEAVLLPSEIALYHAADLPEAVNIAQKIALSGDAVLLSPACASFDMFKNYVHRAEVFVAAVKRLQQTAMQKVAAC
ncbi:MULTISPECIES: UDP-N-acetylmuramoyl-L-alanine--D-glutamate ligase [Methylotenera]|uniref:UDP-N-acetylmuramoyl-L-alanine--D-glutamate ligase n=1 Tax=Methylotenera TaxID=359407 RepID=UPI00037C91A4|nr:MULTISPECIES: UDP-N-acetylmuramoyl-L-alanine--D-glutamate ligase [Methylotenera]